MRASRADSDQRASLPSPAVMETMDRSLGAGACRKGAGASGCVAQTSLQRGATAGVCRYGRSSGGGVPCSRPRVDGAHLRWAKYLRALSVANGDGLSAHGPQSLWASVFFYQEVWAAPTRPYCSGRCSVADLISQRQLCSCLCFFSRRAWQRLRPASQAWRTTRRVGAAGARQPGVACENRKRGPNPHARSAVLMLAAPLRGAYTQE